MGFHRADGNYRRVFKDVFVKINGLIFNLPDFNHFIIISGIMKKQVTLRRALKRSENGFQIIVTGSRMVTAGDNKIGIKLGIDTF